MNHLLSLCLLLPLALGLRVPVPNMPKSVHTGLNRAAFLQVATLVPAGATSAAFWDGPKRSPLKVPLVQVYTAHEIVSALREDLMKGEKVGEFRGIVKTILGGQQLLLRANIEEAATYLPPGKREASIEKGREAVEYLASVVEYDAFDKLKKDYTSTVALRTLTPEKLLYSQRCLEAADSRLKEVISFFPDADVTEVAGLYHAYYEPVELQLRGGGGNGE
ncbi:unnamed protein product [Chrysoparadoxa australica]